MFKKFLLIVLIATFGVVFVYACGSNSNVQGTGNTLSLSLNCPDLKASRQSGIERTIDEVVMLRLSVEGGNPPLDPITALFDADETTLTIDVPVGTDRIFTIEGIDSEGDVICIGQIKIDIDNNSDNLEINMTCDLDDEICNDGIDNDSDNMADCNDPECDSSSCDSGNGICIDGTCQDPDVPPEPGDDDDDVPANEDDFAGECDDEIDNDNDGFTDCDDNDCIRSLDCLPVFVPPPPVSVCEFTEDDGEFFPNCNDPDCCQEDECFCSPICENSNECRLPAFCSNPE